MHNMQPAQVRYPCNCPTFTVLISPQTITSPQTFSGGKCTGEGVAFPSFYHFDNRTAKCVPKYARLFCCNTIQPLLTGAEWRFSFPRRTSTSRWYGSGCWRCSASSPPPELSSPSCASTFWWIKKGACPINNVNLTSLHLTPRFVYPEKCIIFLNLSYLLMALGYLVRLAAGPEGVACTSPLPSSPDPLRLLVQEGVPPTPACTLVFLLLYFSSLAAAMWWTLATASWAVMVLCSLEPKVLAFHSTSQPQPSCPGGGGQVPLPPQPGLGRARSPYCSCSSHASGTGVFLPRLSLTPYPGGGG